MNLRRRRRIGGVAWGVGLAVAALWNGLATSGVEADGVGFAPPVQVAPYEAGRLLAIDVELHSPVRAGDVVARIDPVLVEAERDLAAERREHRLGVELHALEGQLAVAKPHDDLAGPSRHLQLVRQFRIDDERVVAADHER